MRECGQLMSPRIPTLREAVAQDDERPLAQLGNVHLNSIRFDEAVSYPVHWRTWEEGHTSHDPNDAIGIGFLCFGCKPPSRQKRVGLFSLTRSLPAGR